MIMRTVRGYSISGELLQNLTFPLQPQIDSEGVGFRLVSDGGIRTYRGGSWRFASFVTGRATDSEAENRFSSVGIGLRLVWDTEGR